MSPCVFLRAARCGRGAAKSLSILVSLGPLRDVHRERETPEALSGELLELVAGRLRVLSDPWRVRLLLGLEGREASVQELADELDMSHKGASSHLNVLYRDGLLTRRREGKLVPTLWRTTPPQRSLLRSPRVLLRAWKNWARSLARTASHHTPENGGHSWSWDWECAAVEACV